MRDFLSEFECPSSLVDSLSLKTTIEFSDMGANYALLILHTHNLSRFRRVVEMLCCC